MEREDKNEGSADAAPPDDAAVFRALVQLAKHSPAAFGPLWSLLAQHTSPTPPPTAALTAAAARLAASLTPAELACAAQEPFACAAQEALVARLRTLHALQAHAQHVRDLQPLLRTVAAVEPNAAAALAQLQHALVHGVAPAQLGHARQQLLARQSACAAEAHARLVQLLRLPDDTPAAPLELLRAATAALEPPVLARACHALQSLPTALLPLAAFLATLPAPQCRALLGDAPPPAGAGVGVPGKLADPCAPRLALVRHPAGVCVYKRNVKPCPVVLVSHVAPADAPHLCVVPMLHRGDTGADETARLAGREHAAVPASGMVAFRRLKVLVTSRMLHGAPLVLAFELRRYAARNPAHSLRLGGVTEGEFLPLTLAVGSPPNQGDDAYTVVHTVTTSPIVVVSHSSQVRALEASPLPPLVPTSCCCCCGNGDNNGDNNGDTPEEGAAAPEPLLGVRHVVPAHGPAAGGTRVVVLGDFPPGPAPLRVLFGRCAVVPTVLGPRSLLCVTPGGQQPASTVPVAVSTPTALIPGPSFVFD